MLMKGCRKSFKAFALCGAVVFESVAAFGYTSASYVQNGLIAQCIDGAKVRRSDFPNS